jgi:CO/xanthine dehydrogenase Mo-binding subunit
VTFVAGNARPSWLRAKPNRFSLKSRRVIWKHAPEDLEAANGKIYVKVRRIAPWRSRATAERHLWRAQAACRRTRALYAIPPARSGTGATDPFCTLAWAGVLAEVEVDTETGEVDPKAAKSPCTTWASPSTRPDRGQIHGAGVAMVRR